MSLPATLEPTLKRVGTLRPAFVRYLSRRANTPTRPVVPAIQQREPEQDPKPAPQVPSIKPIANTVGQWAILRCLKVDPLLRIGEHIVLPIAMGKPGPLQRLAEKAIDPLLSQFAIHGTLEEAMKVAKPLDILDRAGSETAWSVESAMETLEKNQGIIDDPQAQELKLSPVYKGTVLFGPYLHKPLDLDVEPCKSIYATLYNQVKTCITRETDYMLDAEAFEDEGNLQTQGNRAIFAQLIKDLTAEGITNLSVLKITIQAGRRDALDTLREFQDLALSKGATKLGVKFVVNAYSSSRKDHARHYYQVKKYSQENLLALVREARSTQSPNMNIIVGTMNVDAQDAIQAMPQAKGNITTYANLFGMVIRKGNRVYIVYDEKKENLFAYFKRRLTENREAAGCDGAIKLEGDKLVMEIATYKEAMKEYAAYRRVVLQEKMRSLPQRLWNHFFPPQ